jgi:hypothetical protein
VQSDRRVGCPRQRNDVHFKRKVDVLESDSPHGDDGIFQLVANLSIDLVGNANAPRLREWRYSGGNVDVIAIDVVTCVNDVTQVYPYPNQEAFSLDLMCIQFNDGLLNGYGALYSLQRTGKLDKK